MSGAYILAIDQGTSSTKSLVIDSDGQLTAKGVAELHSLHPSPGFVEQDPQEIMDSVLTSVRNCLEKLDSVKPDAHQKIVCIGITNQRETFLLWDSEGIPLTNAIVWQCKRSIDICNRLKDKDGLEQDVRQRTGLIIDPYFSATKLIWLSENQQSIREAIQAGKAHFGTIDSWLLYRLTNGRAYGTDYTNASRTLLFNLHELDWDQHLLEVFGLQHLNLPVVCPSSHRYGSTSLDGLLSNTVPISAMIGDSHAAAFGECCFEQGMAKATLGTGCSILWNTGRHPIISDQGMLTTICWSTSDRIDYALEGAIVSCGSTIEWLKNQLGLISASEETEAIARSLPDNGGVYLIPAFSGLGAPHWQMDRKAEITGLTFSNDRRHIIRAALESVPFQIKDVIASLESESGSKLQILNIDGGLTNNQLVVQMLTDLLGTQVRHIGMSDVSALGAAYLAGLNEGIFQSLEQIESLSTQSHIYYPNDDNTVINNSYQGWKTIIASHR